MSRQNAILWLRISYWVGAIADAAFALAMVYPQLLQLLLFIPRTDVSVETRLAFGMGASLMFGWTVLLLWANAKPMERRGVLVITACPTIAGLAVTTLYGVFAGYVPIASAAAIWVFQASLVSLFLFGYFRANDVVKSTA